MSYMCVCVCVGVCAYMVCLHCLCAQELHAGINRALYTRGACTCIPTSMHEELVEDAVRVVQGSACSLAGVAPREKGGGLHLHFCVLPCCLSVMATLHGSGVPPSS